LLKQSSFTLGFSEQKKFCKSSLTTPREMAKQIDASFIGAVNAQETKQIKGLNNLEKRLQKKQKNNTPLP
jgi:hypothetical protein